MFERRFSIKPRSQLENFPIFIEKEKGGEKFSKRNNGREGKGGIDRGTADVIFLRGIIPNRSCRTGCKRVKITYVPGILGY